MPPRKKLFGTNEVSTDTGNSWSTYPGETHAPESSYDPTRFYIACGSDSSHLAGAKIPHYIYNTIAILVASPEFPQYKQPADVLRDALRHRIEWLKNNWLGENFGLQESLNKAIAKADRDAAIEEEQHDLLRARTFREAHAKLLEQYSEHEMWAEVRECIMRLRAEAEVTSGKLCRPLLELANTYEQRIPRPRRA